MSDGVFLLLVAVVMAVVIFTTLYRSAKRADEEERKAITQLSRRQIDDIARHDEVRP